jgi:hypothetical protein
MMGQKKKYSVGIDKVCEGTDTELHGDLKSFGTIQKVTKELGEWQEQNDKRAFFLITADVSTDGNLNIAVGRDGDDKILAIMMHGAMNASEDLKKALYTACILQDEIDIDNDSNK